LRPFALKKLLRSFEDRERTVLGEHQLVLALGEIYSEGRVGEVLTEDST
jgi:hypothetical protein